MKSILGLALAAGVVLAFLAAWWLASRESDGFVTHAINQQWLFLVALPYNLSLVWIFGDSDFSPDVPVQIVAATAAEAAVAYIAGAALELSARRIWRAVRRFTSPA
jgi:hypothetical protein